MGSAVLTVDLDALVANWRMLDRESAASVETGAVVKANGYGLGAALVGRTLARTGVRKFFVAMAEEGAALRSELGPGPEIFVLSGHMRGDTDMVSDMALTPMLNSLDQLTRHLEALPGVPFGVQLDSGMNRLGLEPAEWVVLRDILTGSAPKLVMSHLACADEPGHAMNNWQLQVFREMTAGLDVPLSLAATGGILLGPDYHFDLTRPGVGLYGGAPFAGAEPVVTVSLPVIQIRDLISGETAGYGNAWIAENDTRIATLAAGYADGLIRAMGGNVRVWAGDIPCEVVGRVSMDMLTVDVTHLEDAPKTLDILCNHQTVDQLADAAGTIGYEILTSLGARYSRRTRGRGA